jgi:hypothetical protein
VNTTAVTTLNGANRFTDDITVFPMRSSLVSEKGQDWFLIREHFLPEGIHTFGERTEGWDRQADTLLSHAVASCECPHRDKRSHFGRHALKIAPDTYCTVRSQFMRI